MNKQKCSKLGRCFFRERNRGFAGLKRGDFSRKSVILCGMC
ncbi:hypothetical protein HMPREF1981_03244 [Bacteroides pyogenes F0041]|uniref:Uncharacterized protein n=1 Tax=Bacteroides pyogenes F0041 TaxID=1321819 RepID=U2CBJ0_9BACE|nr:hypothetical protein HMPREF1981_03244 [Bacteroides pyogenes F0041]